MKCKKLIISCLIILVVLISADGQIPAFGRCKNQFKPMKDFQKLKFMGLWYEAERFYTMRDWIATCISVSFDRFDDGKIYTNTMYTNRLTNRRSTLTGKFRLINGETRGVYMVRYELLPSFLNFDFVPDIIQNFNQTMTILHTDYENFAILSACRNVNQYAHIENAWLLTRDQEPSEDILQSAYGYLDKFGMRNSFIKGAQQGCPT